MIDKLQYGAACGNPKLPAADYKLAENPVVGGKPRGVYSFCMCPGGIVVPTPTEEGMQCTNGMSNSHRSAKFANAGIVAAVTLEDFAREGFTGPLAGLQWQRKWEKAAYVLGGGGYLAPAMRVSDYLANAKPSALGDTTYRPGLTPADVNSSSPSREGGVERSAARLRPQDARLRVGRWCAHRHRGPDQRALAHHPRRRLPGDGAARPLSSGRRLRVRRRNRVGGGGRTQGG